jgi:hypothetical protein
MFWNLDLLLVSCSFTGIWKLEPFALSLSLPGSKDVNKYENVLRCDRGWLCLFGVELVALPFPFLICRGGPAAALSDWGRFAERLHVSEGRTDDGGTAYDVVDCFR